MPFEPGQSGNPKGSVKAKRFYNALDRAIAQDDGQRLRDTAEKLLDMAKAGEPWAVQMLADRLDGKVPQQLDHGNADGQPFILQISESDANL